MEKRLIYYVDIDGTICTEIFLENGSKDYMNHIPKPDRIAHFNNLFKKGHEIHYWTARGARSGIDWTGKTTAQLKNWGVDYTTLTVGGKPHYDIWIDDKAVNADEYFNFSGAKHFYRPFDSV